MFSHPYRYWFVLLLGGYSFINTLYVEALASYQLDLPTWFVLLVFLGVVLFVWEGNRFADKVVPAIRQQLGNRIHPLLIMFLLSLLVTLAVIVPPAWLLGTYYLKYSPEQLQLPLKITLMFAFRINLFLNTINAIFFFMQQVRETQVESERLKKISLQAQFQSLKNQVNPHFLFNNLNVLSTLVYKDAATAAEFIEELAKVYRYVLQQYEKELVDLDSELAFMESYIYLLEKRFGSSLRIEIQVPEAYRQFLIIPVALQMLIENAIKHNINSRNRPLTIRVTVDDSPALTVLNNLQLKPEKEPSTHIGLANITKRYHFVSTKPVKVTQDDTSFRVTLPLIKMDSNERANYRGRSTSGRAADWFAPEVQ